MQLFATNDVSGDDLYKPLFQTLIKEFSNECRTEVGIYRLSRLIEQFKNSQILNYLMVTPSDETAQQCVKRYLSNNPQLPQDFLKKFLAVISLKINLTPATMGFINGSYNARVIVNNVSPPTQITKLTMETRTEQLRDDAMRAQTYAKNRVATPQTLRVHMDDTLLSQCINAMGDLNRTIVEGNRANNYEMRGYIDAILK